MIVILIFLSVLLSIAVNAQTPSFFKNGARWVYDFNENLTNGQLYNEGTYQHVIIGDTIIQNINYKILSTNRRWVYDAWGSPTTAYQCNTFSLIRHDTISNKVFFKNFEDTTETLLYNFNMIVGDTILLKKLPSSFDEFPDNPLIVDSIFRINLFGDSVKVFVITDPAETSVFQSFIVEGLGSYKGLLWHNQEYLAAGSSAIWSYLSCFENDSIKFYVSPEVINNEVNSVYSYSISSCEYIDCLVGTDNQSSNSRINLFPNPTTHTLHIEMKNTSHTIQSIVLYDVAGKTVLCAQCPELCEVDMSGINNGIYFLHIEMSNGEKVVKKVVKE
jgi:hypothetical protein